MAKTKKQVDNIKIGLMVAVLALLIAVGALAFKSDKTDMAIHTDLGAMQYRFEDGKATERTDSTVTTLHAFLMDEGKRSGCNGPVYHNVVAASEDEKQVLLAYGCEYPSVGMFAVNVDGKWQTISPTNQFDAFGIPSCEHITQHNISVDIAPVCVEALATPSDAKYVVR